MRTEQPAPAPAPAVVVVGAAIISAGRVLACARAEPPELAGRWELPGGKVEPPESEGEALVRECREELAVRVEVGERIGDDVRLPDGRATLRAYLASMPDGGQPQPIQHGAFRWLGASDLYSVPWLPADKSILAALRPILGR